MIAILLATYNGANYLQEQIESILAQTNTNWQLYAHDDGSVDDTVAILKSYAAKYPERIHLLEGNATGCAKKNFFYLTERVEAPYYMYCDQDDVWKPDKIEKTWKAMQQAEKEAGLDANDKPVLIFTELEVVDEKLNTICPTMSAYQGLDGTKTGINRVLMQNVVTGCTMMCNRKLRDYMLQYQDVEQIIMHDWWAALIAAQFGVIHFMEEPTIRYRQHADNSVGALEIHSKTYLAKRMHEGDKIRHSLALTRMQAAEFAKAFALPEDSLAARYGRIGNKGKLARLSFYKQNDMKKTTTVRNIGLVIFG